MVKEITGFSFPMSIIYGPGSIGELPGEFEALGVNKPLIVTDPMMEKTDSFKSILGVLENKSIDYKIFSGVQPNPHDVDVENGVSVYKSADCDFIIGVGGGSPMDAVKGIEFVVKYLEKAVKDPADIEARGYMMLAAMMRVLNLRRGFTDKDDKLPVKMFQPLYDGPSKGRLVSKEDFERMKARLQFSGRLNFSHFYKTKFK